jgi:hypothetical protein
MTLTYTAETLTDFAARIKEIIAKWDDPKSDDPVGLWFRGSQKSQWSLVPNLYRILDKDTKVHEEEDDIREDFVKRAPSLTAYKPDNAWEWYFLMQHYGAPTRLLDWTENPQLGLYFAVKDGEGLNDAAVWVIDPWWLNGCVLGKAEVLPPGSPGLAKSDAQRYRPWLPDRFDAKLRLKKNLPVAVFPNHFDHRIAAQRSCFTIHGLRRGGIEKLFNGPRDHVAKIVIPSYATQNIQDELDEYGIDESTIYPDLQGLGTAVRKGFAAKSTVAPHDDLYTRIKPSPINGVGVFAIRKIKKGTSLFSEDIDEMFWLKETELPKQKVLRKFYDDFAVWRNGRCGVPKHFHRLTMSWYLNDPMKGARPNVACDGNYEFRALRAIKPGAELTVDSTAYSDHTKPSKRVRQRPQKRRIPRT